MTNLILLWIILSVSTSLLVGLLLTINPRDDEP